MSLYNFIQTCRAIDLVGVILGIFVSASLVTIVLFIILIAKLH